MLLNKNFSHLSKFQNISQCLDELKLLRLIFQIQINTELLSFHIVDNEELF
jgi:hypothetical protein